MLSYYVYILKCADNSYYIGITNDLDRRIIEHSTGFNRNCYTFKRRPLKLEFQQEFNDVLEAIYFEKKLKGWTRAKKEALVKGDFDRIKILSECKNETHHKNISK
ncbi:hypothetical protein C7S20_08525 [Christiangramia fulva]|uniref:GIY-YIG domain-containing protein n=1 Tax=Christiangramia fulva TaxID=2126553 RepID=A0A2R3Z4Z5_9FLAO|nr:GIY-YIG nuclease family protein [Christiangramia fulva]AVR45308.1 hypothetical protein C7S20_08525 [Christiangramia fulva]